MGYNNTASTVTLTAKLTSIGRQRLVSTNNNLITSFSLGDSDANYNASLPLTTGEIPASSGDIGPNSTVSNSLNNYYSIKSYLVATSAGTLKKSVTPNSINITTEVISNGQITISGANISQNVVDRNNYTTDSLVNLFYSFGLSLDSYSDTLFTGTTFNNGGFSDTALSGVGTNKVIIIGINNNNYGELIDGKSIKLNLSTTAATFDIYSTYQNRGADLTSQDARLSDGSPISQMGNNVVFLFSDSIKKPNGNSALSWSSGYGSNKPFSLGGKEQYNLLTNTSLAQTADTAVGIAYLDKGFLVITEPTIVNNFNPLSSGGTATTITFDSVSTDVSQNITCIADRGEFGNSTNTTFGVGDVPRISEVALYDTNNNLIAVAKPDRHITKNINDLLVLGIKITL